MKIANFGKFHNNRRIFENTGDLEVTQDDAAAVMAQAQPAKMTQAQPAKMAQAQTKRAQAQKKDSLQTPTDVYNFLMNADNLKQVKKSDVVEIDFYSETNSYALNGQTKFRVAETAPVSEPKSDEQKEAEAIIANGVKNGQKAVFKDGVFTMIEKLPQAQAQKTAPAQMAQMSNPAQGEQIGRANPNTQIQEKKRNLKNEELEHNFLGNPVKNYPDTKNYKNLVSKVELYNSIQNKLKDINVVTPDLVDAQKHKDVLEILTECLSKLSKLK